MWMRSSQRPIQLQERDLLLLRGLFESRVMTLAHATSIFFDGHAEAAKKRLQKLKAARLIGERRRRVWEPSVLFLSIDGFGLLRDRGILADRQPFHLTSWVKRAHVSDFTLRHELEVMDIKSAFHAAARRSGLASIEEFSTWPHLNQFDTVRPGFAGGEVTVKPDGFIRTQRKTADGGLSGHTFFLEVDRSSETLDTLVSRAECYHAYYKSGGFAVRNGASRSAFRAHPFRVLIVFRTVERRNNTAERLLQYDQPAFTQICLSTYAEATNDPFGAIWVRPIDYRDAMKGTPLDRGRPQQASEYRHQSERDTFIEQTVRKQSILASGTPL